MNIIEYLNKNTNKEIKENIANKIIEISQLCEDRIGEGFFGRVYTPLISPIATVKINNKLSVKLPIVIKESKHTSGKFYTLDGKKRLYIYSDRELTAESIILFFISKFWYTTSFPYGPFLVSIHSCSEGDALINKLVTERHGYYSTVEIVHTGINLIGELNNRLSKLETVGMLLEMALNTCDSNYNFTLRLYNKKLKFNLLELVNYIVLHYLIAVDYCSKKGLILTDQHIHNIFVSCITSGSVNVGYKNMSSVTDIYYKLDNNVIIKAPLEHILIKLGDIGSSVLKLRDDLWIIGDVVNEKDVVSHVEKYFDKYIPSYMDLLGGLRDILPNDLFYNSILRDIYTDTHISKHTHLTGYVDPNKFPTAGDLLCRYFTKYIVKKFPTDSKSVFLIK